MKGVLFDYSSTLFWIEDARSAVTAALGEQFADLAPALTRWGAINGSGTPDEVPDHLAVAWDARDLSARAHRAAYSGLAQHAGLTEEQADLLYARGIRPEAWRPFPDTIAVLRRLRAESIPTALVSNIGWDPRPVLETYGAIDLLDALVLSDERGVQKPDPAIFTMACAEIGVAPADAVMVGDNPDADGACVAVGCRFALVPPSPARPADTLLRAVYG